MSHVSPITPCLWFDGQAEEAAGFYTSVFPGSRITGVSRYPDSAAVPNGLAGKALTVAFELGGRPFTALNGGPMFRFNEAVSFQVSCDTPADLDHYWDTLSEGGDPAARRCGWLKDKFGVSWQVVPSALPAMLAAMLTDPDPAKSGRVMAAMMGMTKLDTAELERAYRG